MLGMVNVQHGKRTEVCPAEEWDILSATVQEAMRREGKAQAVLHDLYEFRLLIEPQAAAWMATDGKTDDLAELGELADRMDSLARGEVSVAAVMDTDRSFHDLIVRACGNRVLAAVSRDIREVIGALWGFSDARRRPALSTWPSSTAASPTPSSRGTPRPRLRQCTTTSGGRRTWTCRAGRSGGASPADGGGRGLAVALVIGIDTGGTFTDMVVFDPGSGEVDSLKTSSTPGTPGRAIVNALDEGGVPAARWGAFTHGTTVGTNALIERTGCRVAFVTTPASRTRRSSSASTARCSTTCAGRSRRRSSRAAGSASVSTSGSTQTEGRCARSTRTRCGSSAAAIRESGAEAVALSLLFSYVRTDHEERVKEILAEELPGVPVSVSHEVAPIWREYERASTTIADAYLRPLFDRYVASLDGALREAGMTPRVDDHEVERRRDALRRGRGQPDPDGHVRARRWDDRDRARRPGARRAERPDPGHGRHQRRRRHPRRRTSSVTRPSTRSSGGCRPRCR